MDQQLQHPRGFSGIELGDESLEYANKTNSMPISSSSTFSSQPPDQPQQPHQQLSTKAIPPSAFFPPSFQVNPVFHSSVDSSALRLTSSSQQQQGQQQQPQQQQQQQSTGTTASSGQSPFPSAPSTDEVFQLLQDLTVSSKRERALLELSRRRDSIPDLAPMMWNSFGVMAAVMQEIVSIYPLLTPPTLTPNVSNRACNALALLQSVGSHPDTRHHFLNAHIPLFLYPFLNTVASSRPFDFLRLTSLGVIGALVKSDGHEVIGFLLQTEIISLCLRIMEMGSELSKTVATFVVEKILLDDLGLRYVCATAERFYAVSSVLGVMVTQLIDNPSLRLTKHIVKCYLRLADNPMARDALKRCLPVAFGQGAFLNSIKDDLTTKQNVVTLIELIDNNTSSGHLFETASVSEAMAKAQKQQQLQ